MNEWTQKRIDAVWADLASTQSDRPLKLLRRRLRRAVDAPTLTDEVARGLAELFSLWGVLQVSESWARAEVDRRAGLHEARSILVDAARLASDGPLRRAARFNCGLVELLRALVPDRDMSLLASIGVIGPVLPHAPANGDLAPALRAAYRYFEQSSTAYEQPFRQLAALLIGCTAAELPVRERLEWLRRAEGGRGAAGDLASRERARLSRRSWWTRTFFRTDRSPDLAEILPIELSIESFALPERAIKVLDLWSANAEASESLPDVLTPLTPT